MLVFYYHTNYTSSVRDIKFLAKSLAHTVLAHSVPNGLYLSGNVFLFSTSLFSGLDPSSALGANHYFVFAVGVAQWLGIGKANKRR
mgnify:CR=1 FL=1